MLTEQERIDTRHAMKAKYKNVSLDAELVDLLNTKADRLKAELGFRPTLSQTVRYLLVKNS